MFKAIGDRFRKAQAAGIIKAVFDHYRNDPWYEVPESPQMPAFLVEKAWSGLGHRFSPDRGPRVSAVVVAAVSLSLAAEMSTKEPGRQFLLLCAAQLLRKIEQNERQLGLSATDYQLLDVVAGKLDEMTDTPEMREIEAYMGSAQLDARSDSGADESWQLVPKE